MSRTVESSNVNRTNAAQFAGLFVLLLGIGAVGAIAGCIGIVFGAVSLFGMLH